MADDSWTDMAKKFSLFIMLVLCTLLHGISVANHYIPAIGKVFSVIGMIAK